MSVMGHIGYNPISVFMQILFIRTTLRLALTGVMAFRKVFGR
jgi:hypothetical protein